MFILMITMVTVSSLLTTTRMLWAKERSNNWWEYVVKSTFTQQDWLENFQSTFLYLSNELHSAIEKEDTIMRKVVSTEKRVPYGS